VKLASTICAIFACLSISCGCAAQSTAGAKPTQDLPGDQASQGTTTKQGSDTKIHPAILDPAQANEKAPDKFQAKFVTTKGDFVVEVTREWAPNGADRFCNLVKIGYFKDIAIFRAIKGFMFQFGIHGDPTVIVKWKDANIKDDPRNDSVSNQKGFLTFAHAGRNSRSAQMFINLGDNKMLDTQPVQFPPIGRIVSGAEVIDAINTEYGENARDVQQNFQAQGNAYILKRYPNIDMIKSVELVGN